MVRITFCVVLASPCILTINIRVSYDDNETWMLKKQYAADKCLGGTLAWAVDMKTISQGDEISAD